MKVVTLSVGARLVVCTLSTPTNNRQPPPTTSRSSLASLPLRFSSPSTFSSTLQPTKELTDSGGSDKLRGFGSLLVVERACLHGRIPQNHRYVSESQERGGATEGRGAGGNPRRREEMETLPRDVTKILKHRCCLQVKPRNTDLHNLHVFPKMLFTVLASCKLKTFVLILIRSRASSLKITVYRSAPYEKGLRDNLCHDLARYTLHLLTCRGSDCSSWHLLQTFMVPWG